MSDIHGTTIAAQHHVTQDAQQIHRRVTDVARVSPETAPMSRWSVLAMLGNFRALSSVSPTPPQNQSSGGPWVAGAIAGFVGVALLRKILETRGWI